MRHTFAALALVFALSVPTAAQHIELARVALPGGDFVVDIAEEEDGTLWFATDQGLVRYASGIVRVFTHDSLDAGSISNNYIEEVLVDHEGTLWVGTYGGGLNRYDRASDAFVAYRHDPSDPTSLSHDNTAALYEDRDGVIWVGTRGGLNRLDRETGTFTRYQHDPDDASSISNNWARAIHEDGNGRFWVGSHGGLHRLDRETGTIENFEHDPDDSSSLIEGRVSTILEDSRGRLWAGTGRSEGGLNRLDPEDGSVTRFAFDRESSDWPARPRPDGPFSGGGITDIREDSRGMLWFANWEGWITGFNPETGVAVNYNLRSDDTPEAHPFAIFESQDGTLWFGSVDGILYRSERR